jgi:hypothetical protein
MLSSRTPFVNGSGVLEVAPMADLVEDPEPRKRSSTWDQEWQRRGFVPAGPDLSSGWRAP